MQLNVSAAVNVGPAMGFDSLVEYADMIAKVEGKDLFRHLAKMNTAAGDLAATAVENFQSKDDTFDEVAGLILRAVIFGLAHGMTTSDMMFALGRETECIVQSGVDKRIHDALNDAGFAHTGSFQLMGQ